MLHRLFPELVYKSYLNIYTHNVARKLSSFPNRDIIVNLKFISAPMVEQSELAWRLLVKKNGVDLAYTQMILTKYFSSSKKIQADYIDWKNYIEVDSSNSLLYDFAKTADKPLIAQLAGNNPKLLVESGKLIQNDVTAIDLNLGCPQINARKGGYGSSLLTNTSLIKEIFTTMTNELSCPITAKVRLLPSLDDSIALCQAIESCGVSLLTVHGRTATQNKQHCGEASWDAILAIKQSLSIPVVANGGIDSLAAAQECLAATSADPVMSSEALLENPKMFSIQGDIDFRTDYTRTQLITAREYMKLVMSFRTCQDFVEFERARSDALKLHQSFNSDIFNPLNQPMKTSTRGHLFKILHRYLHAPVHGNKLPIELAARSKTNQHAMDLLDIIEDTVCKVDYNHERAVAEGLVGETRWYDRHRADGSKMKDYT